jgi:hypothetical protein
MEMDSQSMDTERLVWSYELVARGELPHLRLGRRLVVPKHALAMLLAGAESSQ